MLNDYLLNFSDNETTTDAIYLDRVLYWRDQELSNTDWTQLINSPSDATTVTAWATYRAGLRGFESQIASGTLPRDLVIPVKP